MAHTIYRLNDNTVEWSLMSLSTDGSYINDATVTMTLCTYASGSRVVVTDASALAMAYVASSNGKYQGVLPASLTLVAGDTHKLEITATSGQNDAFVSLDVEVLNRTIV